MSDDVRLAFAHPEERASATAPAAPRDRISLRDHIREVEIGAFQAERGVTQRVQFNIVVEVRPAGEMLDDDVDRILSYDTITEAIDHELAAERLNLLETLADRIAARILLDPRAARVFVRIEKLDRGPFSLGVEIVRSQSRARANLRMVEDGGEVEPRVIYLANEALSSEALGAFVDAIEADGLPTILCVGAGEIPAPQTGQPMAQRRVNLLAIEQNAWMLAARDSRCVVVDSRTELDWALKHGQISVWAPSRIVLDATDAPAGTEARHLAAWLAESFDARDILFVGCAAPQGDTGQARSVAWPDPAALAG